MMQDGEKTRDVLENALDSYPISQLIAASVSTYRSGKAASHGNILVRHGRKFFSQNDEDGILLEIIRRIGLAQGSFIEFGVGDGLENNSLILLMSGWRGSWVGGEPLAFVVPPESSRLSFSKAWITRENCRQLYESLARRNGIRQFDVLSIDLDGNDWHILRELLVHGAAPSVIILEYNGKFPPPIEFCKTYDADGVWDRSDWFGASLQSFANLLTAFGFTLVACNITGANAFFVRQGLIDAFTDVPTAIDDLFVAADYSVVYRVGHPTSPMTIQSFLGE